MATAKTLKEFKKQHPGLSAAQAVKSFANLQKRSSSSTTSSRPHSSTSARPHGSTSHKVAKKVPAKKKPAPKKSTSTSSSSSTPPAQQPPATPPNPYQAQIDSLQADLNAMPSQYNDQRIQSATLAAQGLVSSGYFDENQGNIGGNPTDLQIQANQMQHGDVTYNIQPGADGKLYRQAYMKVHHSAAARGVTSSFDINYQDQQQQQALDAKRVAVLQKAAASQTSSFNKEQAAYTKDQTAIDNYITKGTAAQVKSATTQPQGTAPATPSTPTTTPKPKATPKPKTTKPKITVPKKK